MDDVQLLIVLAAMLVGVVVILVLPVKPGHGFTPNDWALPLFLVVIAAAGLLGVWDVYGGKDAREEKQRLERECAEKAKRLGRETLLVQGVCYVRVEDE